MAANTTISITGADYDTIKSDLKTFLKGQTQFADYDFEGSNLSVLIGILAYNSYQNAFLANMAISESFLDSAQLADSVVSRAKELNYLPRGYRSATATVDMVVQATAPYPATISIPAGTRFTSKLDSTVYTFSTTENIIVPNDPTSGGQLFRASGISLHEGTPVTEAWVVDTSNTSQRFVTSNPNIDTTSLSVIVQNSVADSGTTEYQYATSFLGVGPTDDVYWLQGASGGNYELLFGNGIVGNPLITGNIVLATYRACNGSVPNGSNQFTAANGVAGYSNVVITTTAPAIEGAEPESVASIKFNAPRHYQTQERAIVSSDYKTILQQQFPQIEAIHVYGGEELDPPQYGKVVIAVSISNTNGLSDTWKSTIAEFIQTRMALTFGPLVIAPSYLYCKVIADVKFNINKTSMTTADMISTVTAAVSKYNSDNLQDFDSTLVFSKLSKAIDNTDASITSSSLQVYPICRIAPVANVAQTFYFTFSNAIVPGTIGSTAFVYNNSSCYLSDDGHGKLFISSSASSTTNSASIVNIGTIEYNTGACSIVGLDVSAYNGSSIDIIGQTVDPDITAKQNAIIEIFPTDIVINPVMVRV